MEYIFVVALFVSNIVASLIAHRNGYKKGYDSGARDILNSWKEFNIKMFGEEDIR